MADQKLTELVAEATPTDDDIVYVVDDPAGVPTSKKIPLSTLFNPLPGTLTLANAGLHLLDTNASHDLIISPGSDLTADRTLTLTLGDANVAVELIEIAAWEELDRDTLTGSQANIDFQNISQDYEDLMLVCRLRSDRAGETNDQILMYYNNDTTAANYFSDYLRQYDTVVLAVESDTGGIAHAPGATGLANCFCYATIMIPRYAESELHHSHSRSVVRLEAGINLDGIWSHHWETADPIARITLDQTFGPNFVAGSEAILYGLRKRNVLVAV